MTRTHVAFLRGINLGKRRIKMEELRSRVEEAGLEEVDTFLASGNVIFRQGDRDPEDVEAALEEHLEEALGFATEVFVRPLTALERLAGSEELESARGDGFQPHVIFVRGSLGEEVRDALGGLETPDDRFLVREREVVWLRRGGVSDSSVEPRHLEKALGGMDHTMRSLNTVARIGARYGG